jgi:hypothetical protein
MTAHQLFKFGQSEIKNINFCYTTVQQHDVESKFLEPRFVTSRTIPGTHRLHSFRPISLNEIEVREFSASPTKRNEHITIKHNESSSVTSAPVPTFLEFGSLKGYATAEYDGSWWLACILRTLVDTGNI